MEEKGRSGGKTALHVLAFIGVTLALIIIAALIAIYIVTKGPSTAARDKFVDWSNDHGLGFAATLFLNDEETGDADPAPTASEDVEATETPMIIVADEAPEATPEASPEDSGAETSAAPEASPAASDNGEEAQA